MKYGTKTTETFKGIGASTSDKNVLDNTVTKVNKIIGESKKALFVHIITISAKGKTVVKVFHIKRAAVHLEELSSVEDAAGVPGLDDLQEPLASLVGRDDSIVISKPRPLSPQHNPSARGQGGHHISIFSQIQIRGGVKKENRENLGQCPN